MTSGGPAAERIEPVRVVVTGVGAVSAAGPRAPDLWSALLQGRLAPSSLTAFDPGRPAVVAQLADYRGPSGVPDAVLRRLSRSARFALDASMQAIGDSRLELGPEQAPYIGALIGTAHADGFDSADGVDARRFFSDGLAGVTSGLHIGGPSATIRADAASGLIAIGEATALIQSGAVQIAVAGGAEAPLGRRIWSAYEAAGLLSRQSEPNALRPFDLLRDGLVLGEGAAALVLENRDVALARGARIYAEVIGFGQTSGPPGDGCAPTDVDIGRRALGTAIRQAAISPHQIDVVYAAGAGTLAGDARETDILERSLGARILDTYVTTVTPVVGFTVGASGALAAAAAVFGLAEQVVPPHASFEQPDEACGLDFARTPQQDHLGGAAVCAYGTLGQNAAVILARAETDASAGA